MISSWPTSLSVIPPAGGAAPGCTQASALPPQVCGALLGGGLRGRGPVVAEAVSAPVLRDNGIAGQPLNRRREEGDAK